MSIEESRPKEIVQSPRGVARPEHVLYAKSHPGTTFGVLIEAEPSSLALLAAGVAGIEARRARRSARMKSLEPHKTET